MVHETFKKAGMAPCDLLYMYCTVLRPVLDFATPTYHPLLNITQTKSLESLQRRALKIVYGTEIGYQEALALANITTLQERREAITLKFATNAQSNPRFTDRWFPKKPVRQYLTRHNRPFVEERVKTERMKKNPLTYMRRTLNDNQ